MVVKYCKTSRNRSFLIKYENTDKKGEIFMIWCVEDDIGIRDMELYTLESVGFHAKGFGDSEEFFVALENETPELVILDVMLPGKDGIEILKELKATPKTKDIPVIMATAKGMEYDKIQSLDLGADDYLVKPFGMMEMVSRIKAVLRRCNPKGKENVLQMGQLMLNMDNRIVTIDGERVSLTYKEFELLNMFLENPGKAYTREQIFNRVWGEDYVGESRTLDMHIRTLRQKISVYGELIQTVRHVGYRMEVYK